MSRAFKYTSIVILLLMLIQACSFGETATPMPEAAPTTGSVETTQPATEPPAEVTVIVQTEEITVEPTLEPSPTAIVHLVSPLDYLPGDKPQIIHDQESIRNAAQKEAYGGDEFIKGRYERPFDQDMNYIPFIDIKQANVIRSKESEFIYAVIHLMDNPALLKGGEFGFGIELDVDLDGRGDYLIWTRLPQGTDWSVDGVMVWKDANKSIGGLKPMLSEAPLSGDGYEVMIFNSGQGADPDLAWSRIAPEDPTLIQIAFKESFLGETPIFLWGAWSMLGPDQFSFFDHNDKYTHAEAGSPTKSETEFYPLKAMFALDNTCRGASGYLPLGDEPGLCPDLVVNPDCSRTCKKWTTIIYGSTSVKYCVEWDESCE